MPGKRAVVLFNLGGPDSPGAVQPFLFNLFNDPAIIGLPNPFRWMLAKFISKRRAPIAREIYNHIGGKSPLLEQTQAQAAALETVLNDGDKGTEHRVFICMRYWHPMSEQTVSDVKTFGADDVILLPLYPQFSTTTTGSSIKDWHRAARAAGLNVPTKAACCYPGQEGFIQAKAALVEKGIAEAEASGAKPPRVLFSAHGLPKKVIAKGDPYQWQVEQTVASVVDVLRGRGVGNFEPVVCYQSRVGPLEWIGPATEDELQRASRDGVPVVVVPIAFVSEHSETLVELDIEYREVAEEAGVPAYVRVPTVQVEGAFIDGLADTVKRTNTTIESCGHPDGARICPAEFGMCPHRN